MLLKRNSSSEKRGSPSTLNVSNDKVFEMIRQRAYDMYCKRGRTNGNDFNDWVEAEKQVKKELGLRR